MKVTLKLIEAEGKYFPDCRHPYGGIDIKQRVLFSHLTPKPWCDEFDIDCFLDLAEAHGWKVEIFHELKKKEIA